MNFVPKRRKPKPMGLREETRVRSESHKKWVRGHECAIAGRAGHVCGGKIEAAHVRTGTDGAKDIKPGDNWTIPLCGMAHVPDQHQIGEAAFERKYGIDMKAIAAELWRRSPHRRKWEESRGND